MFRQSCRQSCRLPAPRLLLVHILVPKLSSCDLDDPMRLRMGYLLDDVAPELQKERVDRSSSKLSLVQYDLDEYNMCGEGRRRGAVQPAALRAGPRAMRRMASSTVLVVGLKGTRDYPTGRAPPVAQQPPGVGVRLPVVGAAAGPPLLRAPAAVYRPQAADEVMWG